MFHPQSIWETILLILWKVSLAGSIEIVYRVICWMSDFFQTGVFFSTKKSTPQKSNIATKKKGHILKEVTFSKAHHFGYPC